MDVTRRDLIKFGALGSAALAIPAMRVASASTQNRLAQSALPRPFTTPFVVPPVLAPTRSDATTDFYEITMRETAATIVPGLLTPTWGYNGISPGPTVIARTGRKTQMLQRNRLPATHPQLGYQSWTSVHLHGSESLPQYDGYASDITLPGQSKNYHYPNTQEARTLWYHDHGVMHTGPNGYMGLAGQYWLHDSRELSLALPQGRYDIPMTVQDVMLTADGTRLWNDNDETGVYGDIIVVNGRPWPVMKVERRKYRFRILNASVSRSYRWQLDSGEPFVVVGTDAGLMPAPQVVSQFRHGVAERYTVIIDFAKYPIGRRVILRNLSNKNDIDFATTRDVMAFDVTSQPTSTANNAIPAVLNPDDPTMLLTDEMATVTRKIELVRKHGLWTINGTTWADVVESGFTKILANPQPGTVERWIVSNPSGGWHHPWHVHLVDFKIASRNGRPPMAHEIGPKDVVYLGENETVELLIQFKPSHRGRYMMHCHNLVHEDHDMMAQFEVGTGGDDPFSDPAVFDA